MTVWYVYFDEKKTDIFFGAYPSKEQVEERIKYLESKYPCNCYRINTCIYFPYGEPSKIREIKIESECVDN